MYYEVMQFASYFKVFHVNFLKKIIIVLNCIMIIKYLTNKQQKKGQTALYCIVSK